MAAGLDLDALMPPEIDGDIKSIQVELGAIFNDEGIATTFKNKQNALNALDSGVALVDRSHWGRLRISGADRASFLHNQSTNDFRSLAPRTGCDTVFVTSTARCIDLATVLVMESSLMVITSPTMKDAMLQRFDKYIFPGDKVVVQDVSYNTAMLSLLGPESDNILRELAGDAITVIGQPYGSHQILNFQGRGPVIIMAGTELRGAGYTLIADEAVAGDVYSLLASKGCIPLGDEDWDAARILAGRPMPGSELTQDYLPLDAGLFHAVSVNKGCYIGQETLIKVARLNAVKQQLWGLRLSAPAEPGAPITSELSRVGTLTSAAQDAAGEWVGLGYFRKTPGTQLQLDGVSVSVNGDVARVAALPYSTWAFRDGAAPPAVAGSSAAGGASEGAEDGGSLEDRAQKAKQEKAEAQAAAAAAKEERLKALQAQLDAWQAQQTAAKKQTDKAGSS